MADITIENKQIAGFNPDSTDMLRNAAPPPPPSLPPSRSIAVPPGVQTPSSTYSSAPPAPANLERRNIATPKMPRNSNDNPTTPNTKPGGNIAGVPSIMAKGELDPSTAQYFRDRVDWSHGSRNSIAALSDAAQRNGLTMENGKYRPMNMGERDAAGLTSPMDYVTRNQQRINDLNQSITANAKNEFDGPSRIAAAQHSIASLTNQNNELIAGLNINAGLEGKRLSYAADTEGKRLDNAVAMAALPSKNALQAAQAREADAHSKYFAATSSPEYLDRQNRAMLERDNLQTKQDISTRLRDAQRSYASALRTGDPDAIAGAIDTISALNEHAAGYGVPQHPTPQRPMTTEETAAIRAQATTNLENKRGTLGQFFNTKPSAAAVDTEAARLKNQPPPPLKAPRADARAGSKPKKAQPAAEASPKMLNGIPGADLYPGRIIRDNTTGQRFKSNGTHWLEID